MAWNMILSLLPEKLRTDPEHIDGCSPFRECGDVAQVKGRWRCWRGIARGSADARLGGGRSCAADGAAEFPVTARHITPYNQASSGMEMRVSGLQGRVALVTGASQGIGRACAMALAVQGATVALCARNVEKLEEVAAEINGRRGVVAEAEGEMEGAAAICGGAASAGVGLAEVEAALEASAGGGAAHVFRLDLANADSGVDSIKECAKAVIAQLGKVEILVNNAGITRDILTLRMKKKDWDDVLATNLTGAFLMTQAVMQSMLKARWGRVINITSVVGETGQAGQANYAASKAGLIGLTKSLARELASRTITVNAVAPGYIETAMTSVLTEAQRTAMTSQIPLARAGTDRDIAAAVAFLASDEAGYITGHTLDVNGGMYMG